MKWKKLFALALAGVMALALLTGCSGSGGRSEDRLIEENFGKTRDPNIEVSYNIPELTKTIKPDFDPDSWFVEGSDSITQAKQAFLKETLKDYERSIVTFLAFDSTGYSVYTQSVALIFGYPNDTFHFVSFKSDDSSYNREPDYVNVQVCHKTIDGREYCLAVIIESYKETPDVT